MADDATQRNPNPPTPAGHVKAQPPAVSPEVHGAVAPSALAAVAPKPAASTSPIGRVKQFLWPQNTGYAAQVESSREVVETIVFVVVLVLLLKTFIAEAFVIPTGSMATTLWGYQKYVHCPNCGFPFPVNCSTESDPQSERPRLVTSCECPNCRFPITLLGELTGRTLVSRGESLIVEYKVYKAGVPPWDWKPAEFRVDNQTKIRVNGKPATLDDIGREMPVRVLFEKQQQTAVTI